MKPIELEPLIVKLKDAYTQKQARQEKIEMAEINKDMAILS